MIVTPFWFYLLLAKKIRILNPNCKLALRLSNPGNDQESFEIAEMVCIFGEMAEVQGNFTMN
jgi:hypothetical protein